MKVDREVLVVLLHFIHVCYILLYYSTKLNDSFSWIHPSGPQRGGQVRHCSNQHGKVSLVKENLRSTETVLGRGPLVLTSILLDTTVLGRLVVVTAGGVSTLLALDMGVGSVAEGQP